MAFTFTMIDQCLCAKGKDEVKSVRFILVMIFFLYVCIHLTLIDWQWAIFKGEQMKHSLKTEIFFLLQESQVWCFQIFLFVYLFFVWVIIFWMRLFFVHALSALCVHWHLAQISLFVQRSLSKKGYHTHMLSRTIDPMGFIWKFSVFFFGLRTAHSMKTPYINRQNISLATRTH